MSYIKMEVPDSSVGMTTDKGLDGRGSNSGKRFVLYSTASSADLWSTQPPIQWVPGALSPGQNGRGVKLTIHLHLVTRSKWWRYNSTPPYVVTAWCLIN
jgi:hypothetical protein